MSSYQLPQSVASSCFVCYVSDPEIILAEDARKNACRQFQMTGMFYDLMTLTGWDYDLMTLTGWD